MHAVSVQVQLQPQVQRLPVTQLTEALQFSVQRMSVSCCFQAAQIFMKCGSIGQFANREIAHLL